jgi:hypothetical protein
MEVTGLYIDPRVEPAPDNHRICNMTHGNLPDTRDVEDADSPHVSSDHHSRYDARLGSFPEPLGARDGKTPQDVPNDHHSRYDTRLRSLPEPLDARDGKILRDVPDNNRDTIISDHAPGNEPQSPVGADRQRIGSVGDSVVDPHHILGSIYQNGAGDVHVSIGQAGHNSTKAMPQNQQSLPIPTNVPPSPVPQENQEEPPPRPSLFHRRKLWQYAAAIVFLIGLPAAIIALSILYTNLKKDHTAMTNGLQVATFQPTDVLPVVGSSLGAAEIIDGTYFSTSSTDKPQTKVLYDGGNGKLCIQTRIGTTWLSGIRCVEGANPKPLTPLSICDWIGGPSGIFLNTDGYLSSINYVPQNDSWILSSLAGQMIAPHQKSKLASLTWLNGTSLWVHYQDSNGQLREYGLDDYRDVSWRNGSTGPLGLILEGSSIGVSRYIIDGQEIEEVFFQAGNGAIHGRRFANTVWETDIYNINGTDTGITLGASFAATTITQANGDSKLLMAYIETNGFLTAQSRGTVNVTDLGSFAKQTQVVQGDGNSDAGLAADGSAGVPRIYLLKNQKMLMLESDLVMANWTTTGITS